MPLGLLIAFSMVFLTGFYMGFPTAFSIDSIGSWLYVRIWISSRESAPREGDTVMEPSIDWQSILGAGVGYGSAPDPRVGIPRVRGRP